MRSIVSFDFIAAIPIDVPVVYISPDVTPQMDGNVWKGLTVEIEHEDEDVPFKIINDAREVLRDVLTLVGVGIGLEPALGKVHVRPVSALATEPTTSLAEIKGRAYIVRPLRAMPSESLVRKLRDDPKLRRQAEALNAARAESDVVSRIRWSYMVLEQENLRKEGYPLNDYLYLRNGVSHPELIGRNDKAYFQEELGVDFPDFKNPTHLAFLEAQAQKLLDEATRIVEALFCGDKFWQLAR
jgi:hypothetical protein